MNRNFAVIFDMDGVLVNSENAMRDVSIKSLNRFGIFPTHDDFLEFTGMGEDMFIGGVARKYGLEYSVEMKDYAYSLYVKEAENSVFVYPQVKETLQKLKADGFKLAVASAADLIKVQTNLTCIGLDVSFFDTVVSGSDVKNKKPDPEIYLSAAAKIKMNTANCIVIEDAISGITAAKSAGMTTIAVTTSFDEKQLDAVKPDFIVNQISEIHNIIGEWRKNKLN